MGYKVYIGQKIQHQISVKDVLQLDYKNVRPGMILRLFLSENDKRCSHGSYDQCMYDKLAKIMKKETEEQCTVPWTLDNEKICSNTNDTHTAFWIAWNRITNQKRDCLTPCHTTLLHVGAKNQQGYDDKNYSQMSSYFSAQVMKSEEHYFFTIIKLVAQIGGYVGLTRLAMTLLELCNFGKLRQDDKLRDLLKLKRKNNVDEIHARGNDHLIDLSTLAINNV